MQEIAQATYNFQDFNEIMPTIFRRFMEKEAREWRQIYKALQLLEYLVKNGSERVVDDARAHLPTIKILRNFHYIDERGKDQGINIRNRARELAELLSDVDRIRAERRKARANRNKYQGTGNSDFVPGSGGGRYGGFGSDSYYATGGVGTGSYGDRPSVDAYDEYDAGEYEERPTHEPPPKKEEPAVADLFSFDDEPAPAPAAAPATQASGSQAPAGGDDFDDFQAAPSAGSAPPAQSGGQGDLFDFLGDSTPAPSKPAAPTAPAAPTPQAAPAGRSASTASASTPTVAAPKTSSSTFDDLWASSRGMDSAQNDKGKKSMAQLAKDQTSDAVWGARGNKGAPSSNSQSQDLFDLL